jgi:ABC-type lipoprotein release transport system permease subunit
MRCSPSSTSERLGASGADRLYVRPAAEPGDVAHLLHTSSLPSLLAVVLGVLAATTLVSALIAATRQRARDVAVLRALGMGRAAARRTLVSQAIVLAVIGLAVTIPIGVLAGRWLWTVYAEQQGFLPEPATPWSLVVLGALTVIAVAALTTIIPATAVASLPPARHLNPE